MRALNLVCGLLMRGSAVCLSFGFGFANAQPNHADRLNAIQAQTQLLSAELDLKRLQEQFNGSGPPRELPRVLSAGSSRGGALARVQTAAGVVRTVNVGDEVAPGVVVRSIGAGGVRVALPAADGKGKTRFVERQLDFVVPTAAAGGSSAPRAFVLPEPGTVALPLPLPPIAGQSGAAAPAAPSLGRR